MIDTLYLTNFIENQLNQNSLGLKFMIFSDEGDLIKPIKYGNVKTSYNQGLLEIISSEITPIKNLSFQTITAQLMLLVDLVDLDTINTGNNNRPQSESLLNVKQSIYEMIDRLNGQTLPIEIDGRTYALTMILRQPTDGQKTALGGINECLPIYLSMTFNFFENGVNANDYEVIINGENIYFTSAVVSRVKVTEQNPTIYGKSTKSSILTNGIGIDFVMPQLVSGISEDIEDEILSGEDNNAYCVILKRGEKQRPYICVNGNIVQNIDRANMKNIGFNISMVEGIEEILNYKENVWILDEISITEENQDVELHNISNEEVVVFWGDGNYTITSDILINHTYNQAGVYTIRSYNSKATNNEWIYREFTISYNLQGGALSEENPTTYSKYSDTFTLNNPTKLGYTFLGWIGTGIEEPTINVVIPEGSVGDREYTAVFQIIYYDITYNLNGGTAGEDVPTQYTIEDTYSTAWGLPIPDPSKEGYTFLGWTGTGLEEAENNVYIPKGSTGDREYTANWRGNTYTLSYNYEGGELRDDVGPIASPSDEQVRYGDSVRLYRPNYIKKVENGITYLGNAWEIGGEQFASSVTWKWEQSMTANIVWQRVT